MSPTTERKRPTDPSDLTPKGRRTRRTILEAALELFATSGTNAVSLRAIAGEAGITLAGLLRYFSTRDELVVAALELRDAGTLFGALGHDQLDDRVLDDPHRAFLAFARILARNELQPGVIALFSKAVAESTSPDHEAHEHFRKRYEALARALTRAFTAHFTSIGSTADPCRAASTLIALSDGLQVQWLLDPQPGGIVRPVLDYLALHQIIIDYDDATAEINQSAGGQ